MYDIAIIGSGPSGYVAAIRAGQVGQKTVLIEKSKIGGMCLNWGCIPSKSLLESGRRFAEISDLSKFGIDGIDPANISFNFENAVKRAKRIVGRLTKGIEFLLKKNNVEIITGTATIESNNLIRVGDRDIEVKNILIATGSRPEKIGISIPSEKITELDSMLSLKEIPERIIVEGESSQAVEMAQFFNKIGKKVILNIKGARLLPELDSYLSEYMTKLLTKDKIDILTNSTLNEYKDGVIVTEDKMIEFDLLINALSRKAIIPENSLNFNLDSRGYIKVDKHLQTSIENVFAIGDVNGISKFAHSASAQGLNVVNYILGTDEQYNDSEMPINIYTYPEIAQIGSTEDNLKKFGTEYKISEFPLTANGKALIENRTTGFIRLLSETKYGEVLGVQIVSSNATEMIAEASVLKKLEGTVYDLAKAVHAHPTISEIFMESGFGAFDQPIHQ